MPSIKTANPRRTTLAEVTPEQLREAERRARAGRPEDSAPLPAATANPRRTTLDVLPTWRPNAD